MVEKRILTFDMCKDLGRVFQITLFFVEKMCKRDIND